MNDIRFFQKMERKVNQKNRYCIFLPSVKHGGHEKMLFKIILEKCKDPNVEISLHVRYSAVNSEDYRLLGAEVEKINISGYSSSFGGLVGKMFQAFLDSLALFFIALKSDSGVKFMFAPGVLQSNFWFPLIPKLFGLKVIVYVPMCFPAVMLNVKKPVLRDYIVKKFVSLCDVMVVITQSQYQLVRDYWEFKKKCIVINNYYEIPDIAYQHGEIATVVDDEYRFIYAGRFDWYQKGLDWLVKYISKQKNIYDSKINFVIKGEGVYESEIKKLENISRVSVEKWSKLKFNKNDILIMTSRYEGFPLVAIEAICADIPIIATSTSGLNSILNPECLFDFGDDDGLTNAILWIINKNNYFSACKFQKEMFEKINLRAKYLVAIREL